MGSKNKKINIDKDCLKTLYLDDKLTSKEIGLIFNCSTKSVRNYLHKYNLEVRSVSESVKLERSKWSDEKELNRYKKFHQTYINKPESEKILMTKGLRKYNNTPQAIEKAKNTKLKRGTYKTSKAEDNFYKKLLLKFNSDDIIRGYYCERYPFNCDFYIKSIDLFIEYQGHWTHGHKPYEGTEEDINYLTEVNTYLTKINKENNKSYSMDTWLHRDPIKIQTAKDNKINLLLIYPKYNNYLIKNGQIQLYKCEL